MSFKSKGRANFRLVDTKDDNKPVKDKLINLKASVVDNAASNAISSGSAAESPTLSPQAEKHPSVHTEIPSTSSSSDGIPVIVPSTSLRRPPKVSPPSRVVHARAYGLNGVARFDQDGRLRDHTESNVTTNARSPSRTGQDSGDAPIVEDLNLFDTDFGTPGGPIFM